MLFTQARAMTQIIMEGDCPYLPQEIIRNILKRLPVKSLIRFQCVCKHWKNLLKFPSFIEEHLHHSTHQNPSILVDGLSPTDIFQLYLLDTEMQLLEVHSGSLIDLLRDATIVGSSNGLVCVRLSYSSHPILLWNPAIGRFKLVADAANCFEGNCYELEFGFCSIVNDYQILRINVSNARVRQGEIYSLKTELWKKVECGTLDGVAIRSNSIAADGKIFWFGFKFSGEGRVHLLVSYDLKLEVFTLILSPISFFRPIDSHFFSLTVYENKLAILSHNTIDNFESSLIDLWVMEEGTGTFGERWDWTKKYSISHPCWLVSRTIWRNKLVCYLDIVTPRQITANDGDVKDDDRKNVVLVNLTTNEFKMVAIHKCGIDYPILNYMESLVPVENDYIEEL